MVTMSSYTTAAICLSTAIANLTQETTWLYLSHGEGFRYTHTHRHTDTHTDTQTHTRTHTHTHTHTTTHTPTHTPTHTHNRFCDNDLPLLCELWQTGPVFPSAVFFTPTRL